MSRDHVEKGMITLHPGGIPHGPHPGTVEKSIGAKETHELAVMVDTFEPLVMTEEALAEFRASPGWAAGADVEYVANDSGANLSAETTTVLSPVIAVVFGQAGLLAGASVEGTKYTRIIP